MGEQRGIRFQIEETLKEIQGTAAVFNTYSECYGL